MAERDRKKWLELFYNRLNYQPVERIRRLHKYNRKVDFYEVLDIADETNTDFLIRVIFPFENSFPVNAKPCDSIVVFPQILYYDKGNLFEIAKPILYNKIFYSLDDFIKKCPDIYLANAQSIFGLYSFSLSFLMLSMDEISDLRRHLTSARSQIVKTGFYPESRGKNKRLDPTAEYLKRIIGNKYIALNSKKRIPIVTLKKTLIKNVDMLFPNDLEKAKKYNWTEETIRRVIKAKLKK